MNNNIKLIANHIEEREALIPFMYQENICKSLLKLKTHPHQNRCEREKRERVGYYHIPELNSLPIKRWQSNRSIGGARL